jgi:hypothetical protein
MIIRGFNNMNPYTDNTGWAGIGNTMPMSMLHLGETNCYSGQECSNGTLAGGWRNWMSSGAFICYNTDNMYIGMKDEGSDLKDAIIAWGDNLGFDAKGPDNLRFVFGEYCLERTTDVTASGPNGLEAMRLMPYVENGNFISINVGVGNYSANSPVIPPQRRLEVLDMAKDRPQFRITYTQNANLHNAIFTDFQTTQNGDLNIRGFSTGNSVANGKPGTSTNRGRVGFNLPLNTDPSNTVEINSGISSVAGLRFTQLAGTPILGGNNGKVLTVDANGDLIFVPEGSANVSVGAALSGQLNYISKWTNNTLPGEICQTNIYEAEPSNNVGIDYNGYAVTAKLNVNFTTSPAATVGIQSVAVSGAGVPVAVYGFSTGTSGTSNWIGVKGEAAGSVNNFENVGVWGIGGPGFTSTNNGNYSYGVWGLAQCQAAVGKNWGVYGQAIYGPSGNNHGVHGRVAGANDWAGWFDGNVFSTGTYQGSDSILKTNVNEIQDALNGIMALKPKTYLLDTAAFSQMNLPPEEQFGLIAQELEDVYPTLVRYAYISPEYDTVGNMISEEMKLKAVNYTGLILERQQSDNEMKKRKSVEKGGMPNGIRMPKG